MKETNYMKKGKLFHINLKRILPIAIVFLLALTTSCVSSENKSPEKSTAVGSGKVSAVKPMENS
jgi:hypothetical protein